MDTDIVVIGAGGMGSAALWRLAERGVRAVAFEQFEPGHDRGSSHGETRAIRTAYFESPAYVPLVRRAFALWRELEQATGTSLLTRNGMLSIGRPDGELIAGVLRSVHEHTLPHQIFDSDTMRELYPQHRMRPDEIALFEADAGFVRPEVAVQAALSRAFALGATVVSGTHVERIEAREEGVQVVAGNRTWRARHVIVAAGPWLPDTLPDLGLPLVVSRQVTGWFPVRQPELFQAAGFPVFLHELEPGRLHYGFPCLDGQTIKVSDHHVGAPSHPDRIDRVVKPDDLITTREFIQSCLLEVESEPVRTEVCMYTNTPDGHFLVGAPRLLPHLTVLGGFSGHGFKFAPVLGEVAADLALHGCTDYSINPFALDRFP